MSDLTLNPIHANDRTQYLPYLLMADEAEMIQAYLHDGELFSIHMAKGKMIGVALFIQKNVNEIELKNFALVPESRGKGMGQEVISSLFTLYKEQNYKRIIVGTANCSIENIAFYQKAGFRMERVEKGFFLNYPNPIYENGIRAMDMIVFEKDLIDAKTC